MSNITFHSLSLWFPFLLFSGHASTDDLILQSTKKKIGEIASQLNNVQLRLSGEKREIPKPSTSGSLDKMLGDESHKVTPFDVLEGLTEVSRGSSKPQHV